MDNPSGTTTVEEMMKKQYDGRPNILYGDSMRDQRTIICVAHRGPQVEKKKHVCKCGDEFNYEKTNYNGLNPIVVDSWDRIIKPMNQAVYRFFAVGFEVADAYNNSIKSILEHPQLKDFPYILFIEDDMIIPYVPNSLGPLLELMRLMDNYDIAGALYWTKGSPSLPLIYGSPGNEKFDVVTDWKEGDVVPCNGMGMGFTLMKLSMFADPRTMDADGKWFKTVNEHNDKGISCFTQDLYFMEKAVIKCGYKAAVHTGIRVGHLDFASGEIF